MARTQGGEPVRGIASIRSGTPRLLIDRNSKAGKFTTKHEIRVIDDGNHCNLSAGKYDEVMVKGRIGRLGRTVVRAAQNGAGAGMSGKSG